MEISKVLELSTAHISETTAKQIDNGQHFNLVIYDKEGYGWFIFVSEDAFADDEAIPADLYHLLHLANKENCDWLMLDRDGEIDPKIPNYEWK